MNKGSSIKDWQEMYNKLTNPELRNKAKREADKIKRKEDKIKDTGLNL